MFNNDLLIRASNKLNALVLYSLTIILASIILSPSYFKASGSAPTFFRTDSSPLMGHHIQSGLRIGGNGG